MNEPSSQEEYDTYEQEMSKIKKDIVDFHGEMVLLVNYSNINYTGKSNQKKSTYFISQQKLLEFKDPIFPNKLTSFINLDFLVQE